jgi:hypothetical protein
VGISSYSTIDSFEQIENIKRMNQQTHKQLIRHKLKEIDEYKRMGNQLQSHSGEKRRIAFLIEGMLDAMQ